MKRAALLKGSGSDLSNIKLIIRWTGRNNSRKRPARAITNFFETDEKRILFMNLKGLQVISHFQVLEIKVKLIYNISNEQIPFG